MYYWKYKTGNELDDIILYSSGQHLERLDFFNCSIDIKQDIECFLPVFQQTVKWLDLYFTGNQPGFDIDISIECTEFQKSVYEILKKIPFGQYRTYGSIANEIAEARNIPKMSARAVGQAVGANPVAIIIPCHRVLGSGRKLTGYSGGIKNKIALLKNEKIDFKAQ